MRGGRSFQQTQREAVIREHAQAVRLGAHELAAKIEKANPDIFGKA